MNKKQLEMIRFLSAQNRAMSGNEIANALQVSSRTVKNYVHEINGFYGRKIISASRSGYELQAPSGSSLFVSSEEATLPQTQEERSFYIIKQLVLHHSSKLDLFELCDVLAISYSTIKAVVSKMNKMFSAYHVEFQCENDFLYITGSEKDKRRLISYIINEETKNSYINLDLLRKNFANIDIAALQSIIFQTFKRHHYYLNDFAALNLLLHLLIIIDREMNGNALDSGQSDFEFSTPQEQAFLKDLRQQIEQGFQIQVNNFEYFELYMLFKTNANFSLEGSFEDLKKVVGEDILNLTQEYVRSINSLYMIDLSSNSFKTPFALHLKNLIFRAQLGRFTKNPMAQAIKNNSPIVFDIAIYLSLDLMERYNITVNEDEAAFLAIHIGAEIERQTVNHYKVPAALICPEYHTMASHILNAILLNFGNQLHMVCTASDEQQFARIAAEKDIAIIFSTIPLHNSYSGREIVYISPLNLSAQLDKIQTVISKELEYEKNQKLRIDFHTYFEEDIFVADAAITDKEQALRILCNKLLEKKYVHFDFYDNVWKRENAATTAFGSVAIPHAVEMDAVKTSVAVAISKQGIQWGTNTVYIVFLLAINKADKRSFRNLYESLISLFGEPSMIPVIRNCESFHDFEKIVCVSI